MKKINLFMRSLQNEISQQKTDFIFAWRIDGLRDEKLLDSAASAPFQTFDGQDLYPSLLEKAAQLCYGLIKIHPFLDGNKRIGLHAMLVFLTANNISVECDNKDLTELIFRIADGTLTKKDLLTWLAENAKFDWRFSDGD